MQELPTRSSEGLCCHSDFTGKTSVDSHLSCIYNEWLPLLWLFISVSFGNKVQKYEVISDNAHTKLKCVAIPQNPSPGGTSMDFGSMKSANNMPAFWETLKMCDGDQVVMWGSASWDNDVDVTGLLFLYSGL